MPENVRYVDSKRDGLPTRCVAPRDDARALDRGAASVLLALLLALMATLHLRNVPDDVDAALRTAAGADGVSKNRRAIEALRRGLGLDQVERSELIDQIRRRRRTVDVDVAAVIREDRPGDRG